MNYMYIIRKLLPELRIGRKTTFSLLGLMLLQVCARQANAQDDPAKVTVTGSGPVQGPLIVAVGEESSIDFSAVINHDPTPHQECQLNGMTWSWTGAGGDVTSNDSSATVSFKFDQPGDYTVSASATTTFATSCGVDNNTHPGDNIVLSGEKSYRVKAVAKTWSSGPGIGTVWDYDNNRQATGEDGTVIFDGRILSPQDQTVSPATPDVVYVSPNGTLNFTVQSASDVDMWYVDLNGNNIADNDEKHFVADSVKYHWSGEGTFTDPNSTSSSWTAPKKPQDYSLTCEVNDVWDAGATGISAPDAGSRNDTEPGLVRSVTVKVVGVTSVYVEPGQPAAVMSGALENDDHQVTVFASIGAPLAGVKIRFMIVDNTTSDIPAKISVTDAVTDESGVAQTVLTSSNTDTEGTVSIQAYATDGDKSDQQSTTVNIIVPDNEYGDHQ